MHMLGEPRTCRRTRADDVVDDIKAFLEERLNAATAGIDEERIQLDPGIGFGKTLEHNLELLRWTSSTPRRPIVIGTSQGGPRAPHRAAT